MSPFALGAVPTDLAHPGDGEPRGWLPCLLRNRKASVGKMPRPSVGGTTCSLRPACAFHDLGWPHSPPGALPFTQPFPGTDALSCQKDVLVMAKFLLVSGLLVPWPRTCDVWSLLQGLRSLTCQTDPEFWCLPCPQHRADRPCAQVPECPQWPWPRSSLPGHTQSSPAAPADGEQRVRPAVRGSALSPQAPWNASMGQGSRTAQDSSA